MKSKFASELERKRAKDTETDKVGRDKPRREISAIMRERVVALSDRRAMHSAAAITSKALADGIAVSQSGSINCNDMITANTMSSCARRGRRVLSVVHVRPAGRWVMHQLAHDRTHARTHARRAIYRRRLCDRPVIATSIVSGCVRLI